MRFALPLPPVVVTYEDRISALPGVEILARSLHRHSPELPVLVYSPFAETAERLADLPNVSWVPTEDLIGRGWNAKPIIMLRALETHEQALWLDTDIAICGDLRPQLARVAPDALVVAQAWRRNKPIASELRVRGFGLAMGRPIALGVCSGSMRAGRRHIALLERWLALTETDDYRAAQTMAWRDRPIAFGGDQDALWALLASSEFADVSLDHFRIGRDMILDMGANGYHVLERLGHLIKHEVTILHMGGRLKAWSFERHADWRRDPAGYFRQLCYELSPFFKEAGLIAEQLGNPAWLRRRCLPARLLNALALGNPALSGLPPALIVWLASSLNIRRPRL